MKTYQIIERNVNKNVTNIVIKNPNGEITEVMPFKYVPIAVSYNEEGYEKITAEDKCEYKYRFAPSVRGTYYVCEMNGEKKLSDYKFEVDSEGGHGYIKVNGKNRKYFSYTDGTVFLPVGMNMVFPTKYQLDSGVEFGLGNKYSYLGLKQYEAWIRKASKYGVNLIRIWCSDKYFEAEKENAGEYAYERFTLLDKIFELAHKYNVKIKLTLEQFRYFSYDKEDTYINTLFGKRLYNGGRRCESTDEWLSESLWQDKWIEKVSEYAKRYAYDDALFAVELWNEMNGVGCKWGMYDSQITKWNQTMSDKVRKLFPKHMIINSIGSYDSDISKAYYDNFCWEKFDFKQIHSYLDQGAVYEEARENPIEILKRACREQATEIQPLLVAETGAVNNNHSGPFRFYSSDDFGLIFADCVYTPLFLGAAGCGNIWHWDGRYMEFKNLYHMYLPFLKLTENIDFTDEDFKPIDCSDDNAYILSLKGKNHDLYYIRNKSANWKNMLRDLNEPSVIPKFEIPLKHKAKLIQIWNDGETFSQNETSGFIHNLKKGIFLKVQKGVFV